MFRSFACILLFLTVGCATFSYEIEDTSDKCCIEQIQDKDWYLYIYEKNYATDSGAYSELKKILSEKGFKEIEGGKQEPISPGDGIHYGHSVNDPEFKALIAERRKKFELKNKKEKEIRNSLCLHYQNLIILTVEFLSVSDYAQGQAFITGLSCGLIPSWVSTHPIQKYTFQIFENCTQQKYYSFVEYEKAFFWLFAIPFSEMPRYKESGQNVAKGIILNIFGNIDTTK